MSQRSQIYIRFQKTNHTPPVLIAKYYSWNYGERMISRARHGIEYIKRNAQHISIPDVRKKIEAVFDVNFDMKDVQLSQDILKEYLDFFIEYYANMEIFIAQDNNDGKLFVDIDEKGNVKYCFTDSALNILSPQEYMDWDYEGWETGVYLTDEEIQTCKENIDFLNNSENASLMTEQELKEFVCYDYSEQLLELAHEYDLPVVSENLHCHINFETLEVELTPEDCV